MTNKVIQTEITNKIFDFIIIKDKRKKKKNKSEIINLLQKEILHNEIKYDLGFLSIEEERNILKNVINNIIVKLESQQLDYINIFKDLLSTIDTWYKNIVPYITSHKKIKLF